eukprot:scaffold29466_cov72-Skeletonema_dohrnii-CCMP3373.AAC.1
MIPSFNFWGGEGMLCSAQEGASTISYWRMNGFVAVENAAQILDKVIAFYLVTSPSPHLSHEKESGCHLNVLRVK